MVFNRYFIGARARADLPLVGLRDDMPALFHFLVEAPKQLGLECGRRAWCCSRLMQLSKSGQDAMRTEGTAAAASSGGNPDATSIALEVVAVSWGVAALPMPGA